MNQADVAVRQRDGDAGADELTLAGLEHGVGSQVEVGPGVTRMGVSGQG